MRVFKCSMENLNDVADFYDKVTEYLVSHINYPRWIPGEYPCRESTREAIERGFQYACVDDDGYVAGAFILNDNPEGSYEVGDWKVTLSQGEYLVIHTLATDPEIYHQGIGRRMVEYCIQIAKELGYKAIRLDAVPDNYPAKKMYEGMGFSFAGDKDLERGYEHIPLFSLYELNLED